MVAPILWLYSFCERNKEVLYLGKYFIIGCILKRIWVDFVCLRLMIGVWDMVVWWSEVSADDIIYNFLLGKWLSVKVLINKDNFEIIGEFLVRWKFDFWVVKWLKCLILVGFDDMGYDKWFGMIKFGNLLDFSGDFEDIDKVKFWRRFVNKSAIGFAAFPGSYISFCHPLYTKNSD